MPWNGKKTARTGKCPGCFEPDCECQNEAPAQEQPDPFPTTKKAQREWAQRQATPEQISALIRAGVPEQEAWSMERQQAEKLLAEADARVKGTSGTVYLEGDWIVIRRNRWQRRIFGLPPEQRFSRADTRVEYRQPTPFNHGYLWFIHDHAPDTERARPMGKIGRDPDVVVIQARHLGQVDKFLDAAPLDGAVYQGRSHRFEDVEESRQAHEVQPGRVYKWFERNYTHREHIDEDTIHINFKEDER